MTQPTKYQFLKDVENHNMTVYQNEGLYHHLRFDNGTNNYLNEISYMD